MSSPSEIVEFLRVRLAEDERTARSAGDSFRQIGETGVIVATEGDRAEECASANWAGVAEHIVRHDPARVLKDIKSKRSIVDAYVKWSALPQAKIADHKDGFAAGLLAAVEALAATYSDHPDYEPGWRL